jgi:uncharacterized protein (TIGR02145 family)
MAENLNYRAGVNGSDSTSWCYGNDAAQCGIYGRLYDWNTAMSVCPSGWHLPSNAEWDELATAVGGSSIAGKELKSALGYADGGWYESVLTYEDPYEFSALPGGNRSSDGSFDYVGYYGYWWGSTELNGSYAYGRYMDHNYGNLYRHGSSKSGAGLSVRCVKDSLSEP